MKQASATTPLSDTAVAAQRLQLEPWRRMSPLDSAPTLSRACRAYPEAETLRSR